MVNNTTQGKLHELEALANYLQCRIQYELKSRSELCDKSYELVCKASVVAIDLTRLLQEAKGWNASC